MNHILIAFLLGAALGCGDNGDGAPIPDVAPPVDAAPDAAELPCIVLGCPVPTCSGDPAVCTCNGTTCVPTGIPKPPPACAALACVSLACGMGNEAGVCQCELSSGTFETCLAE